MQTNFLGLFYVPKLKLLSLRETPASRVSADPSVCTNLELLATAIGGPKQIETAEAVSSHFNGDLHRVFQASVAELVSIPGVGEATAARLKSALTLSRRLAATSAERISINSPREAAALCEDMSTLDVEHLRVIVLNTRNNVLGIVDVYKGSVNSSQIRIGEVFRPAIQRNATGVILAHNHPGGGADPSPEDVSVTHELVKAGKLLNIEIVDHIVIGHGRWVSLKEKGIGFA